MSSSPRDASTFAKRVYAVLRAELGQFRPVQHLLSIASRTIPPQIGNDLRVSMLRARGVAIGQGTIVHDTPEFSGGEANGAAKMVVGRDCVIEVRCAFELGETITIGNRVTLGHNVMILTTTHELGPREHRAGPITQSPVRIEDGAWIGPCTVILPGVTIGAGAIVDPGSVVNKNVPPNMRVGGTPARKLEELTP